MTDESPTAQDPSGTPEPATQAEAAPTKGKRGMKTKATDAPLPFEAELWRAADLLRGQIEPSEYKHIILGLIFLKFVSESFEHRRQEIGTEVSNPTSPYFVPDPADQAAALEDRDHYTSRSVSWIPTEARWSVLQANAKQSDIGMRIDTTMDLIERENPDLRGVLPKVYGRTEVKPRLLGELIDVFSNIPVKAGNGSTEDVLGRVYEYFLGRFGNNEGGEFYTPQHVVRLLVEMLEPYKGRVYDPCCGSGGMFVQSVKFVEEHGGRRGDVRVLGQEAVPTTWRLGKMNLAVRHIDANLGEGPGDSFHEDKHPDLRADFVIANPPFNQSEWGGQLLRQDPRWVYGTPPPGNANFAWVQNFLSHLAPTGTAGFVLANGALTAPGVEGEIRRRIIDADLVDCIVALPGQLFFGTPIAVSLWFLAKGRARRDATRRRQVLFINGTRLGTMADRTHRQLSEEDVARIATTYHAWREGGSRGDYDDVLGFCKSATIDEVASYGYVLSPGRYVGAVAVEDDGVPFDAKMRRLVESYFDLDAEGNRIDEAIAQSLRGLGYGE